MIHLHVRYVDTRPGSESARPWWAAVCLRYHQTRLVLNPLAVRRMATLYDCVQWVDLDSRFDPATSRRSRWYVCCCEPSDSPSVVIASMVPVNSRLRSALDIPQLLTAIRDTSPRPGMLPTEMATRGPTHVR